MSENAFIHKEMFGIMCGEYLGEGIARKVYASNLLKNSVIKCEEGRGSFQNIIEWETWDRVKHTEYAKWFAPCEWISACGSVLIMARTTKTKRYPGEIPVFITDLKHSNFGMYKGNFVCHDYGTHLLFEHGMGKRMKKADWWD